MSSPPPLPWLCSLSRPPPGRAVLTAGDELKYLTAAAAGGREEGWTSDSDGGEREGERRAVQ